MPAQAVCTPPPTHPLQTSVPERLVRRRLRLLARKRVPFHEKRFWLWAISLPPQAPLVRTMRSHSDLNCCLLLLLQGGVQ